MGLFSSSSSSRQTDINESISSETGQQFNNIGDASAQSISGFRLNEGASLTLSDYGAIEQAYQISRDSLAAIDRALATVADQAGQALEAGFSAARRTEQSVMEYGTTQAAARNSTVKYIGGVAIAIAIIIALVMMFK